MAGIVYINGSYLPSQKACISINDRGFQFADSVYEVIGLMEDKFIDLDLHIERLFRSCYEIRLPFCLTSSVIISIIDELKQRNRVRNGYLYIQVTRGVAPRSHLFPKEAKCSLLMSLNPYKFEKQEDAPHPVSIITLPESRWARPDIKSTSLLANILAKQQAYEEGSYEAIFINHEGWITEGSHSNIWIVNKEGKIQTPPTDQQILGGIARLRVLKLLKKYKIEFYEKNFTYEELISSQEIFLTGTLSLIKSVGVVDGHKLSRQAPGSVTMFLREKYFDSCLASEEYNESQFFKEI
jgi:D-alanine transaminase